jgi:hypothetical protein
MREPLTEENKYRALRLLPLFVIACPFLAQANALNYSFLNLPKAGIVQTVLFILLCCALIAALVVYEVLKIKRERERLAIAIEERFIENAKRYGLDKQEMLLLRSMERHAKTDDPNALYDTLALFEQGVDAEVTRALESGAPEYEQQELEDILQSLRKKLHYTIVDEGLPIPSSRNLSQGQRLWVLGPRKTVLGEASVALVREFFFTVKLSLNDFAQMPSFQSPIRLAFTRKADGIYGIETPLIGFDRSRGVLKCRHTLKFKRNQLRQDVRVETDLQISIRCLTAKGSPGGKPPDTAPFMVRMTDISGGGFAFVTERRLEVDDTVMVAAAAPKLTLGGLRAKIVALSQNRGSSRILYHTQFSTIDFEKKEAIVRYVFARLREINQR